MDDEIIDLEEETEEIIEEIIEEPVDESIEEVVEQPTNNAINRGFEQPKNNINKLNESIKTPQNYSGNPSFNNKPNLFKQQSNDNSTTSNKLRSLGNQNRSFPQLGTSNFNNEEENQNKAKQAVNDVKTKVGAQAITAASGGAINGQAAEKLSGVATTLSDELQKKLQKKIIIICAVVACIFILLIAILSISSNDEDIGKNTYTYVTGAKSEEDLTEQLMYYGYCDTELECKSKGIYKFLNKLKTYYDTYQKDCPTNITINNPCEITLNSSLIIETANYYQNSTEAFDTYNDEDANNLKNQEGFSLSNFFSSIVSKYKKQQAINDMIDDVGKLALAQAEYVQETCRYLSQEEKSEDLKDGKTNNKENEHTIYYYQISYNKYISYLKYGDSSDHPNYQGNPVVKTNEICEYAVDDYSTSFDTDDSSTNNTGTNVTITGSGKGVEIAKYAIQFVGNPYVWGGTSLTNGTDCSGFTMRVMEHFGITIPRTASEQYNSRQSLGTDISSALPGDLIFYAKNGTINHVAIYIGNNQVVHASSPSTGIKITNNASYRQISGIIRFWS